MVERLARSFLLALVGVVAVALSAATLTSTVSPATGGAIGANGTGSGGIVPPPSGDLVTLVPLPVPSAAVTAVAVLFLLGGLWYVLVHRYEALQVTVATLVAIAAIALLLYGVFQLTSSGGTPVGNGSVVGTGGGAGGFSAGEGDPTLAPPLLVVLLGVAVAAAVGVLVRGGTDEDAPDADETPAATTAVGRAAGRAADRIEDEAAVDNEVYRAWAEMTDLLDVPDPETSTPREFEAAAVDAGMAAEDVRELTRLFEAVRYGGVEPDGESEQRAVAVLRRIEAAYAGAEDA